MDADEKIQRYGLELAPPGTYTNDLEWRWALKPGDLFDCCDDYGIWYRCTVQARYDSEDSQDCEGNPVPMLSVVFRYPDPNGAKQKDGVKVTGWINAQYDMEQELFSPCVQRFWAYSTQYFNVGPDEMKYDHDVKDQEDVVFASKRIEQYAVHREGSSAGIKHFANFVDEFGHKGGFESIITFFNEVASGKVVATLEHLGLVLAFLSRTMALWTRHFLCHYIKRVD